MLGTTSPRSLPALHRQPFLVAVTGMEASFAVVGRSVDDTLEDDPGRA